MNVLIIHQNFADPQQPGGTRHFELASFLVQRGHRVTIVAGSVDYLSGKRIAETRWAVARQETGGVHVLRAYVYPSLHRSFTWRVVSFLSFMFTSVWAALRAGPVDVVIGTSPPIFQLPSAWLVATLKRRPFLLEVRDLWPEFAIDMGILTNPLVIRVARWVERFFYARADHIVVNSPAYKQYLAGRRVWSKKITVVPNGVDPDMFPVDVEGSSFRRQCGFDGQFVVTYAGALGQANDIGTILRAAERLQHEADIRFLLVGDGKERENLEQQAQSRGLSNVVFAGTVPKERMPEVLAASDACVATLQDIPMFRTTYPNKVFDYMAAGKPTILGIDGVIREVVEAAQGGIFVPPGDAQSLADAVRSLSHNRNRACEMGRAARQYVSEHFDRREHAARLETLLQNLASRTAAAAPEHDAVPTLR